MNRYHTASLSYLLLCFSCSISAWGDQTVFFRSDPPGATVEMNGLASPCTTPCKIHLPDYDFDPAGGAYETAPRLTHSIGVTIKKKGYKDQVIELTDGPLYWEDDKRLAIQYYYIPQSRKSYSLSLQPLPSYQELLFRYQNGDSRPDLLIKLKELQSSPNATEGTTLAANIDCYLSFMAEAQKAQDDNELAEAEYKLGSAKDCVRRPESPGFVKVAQDQLNRVLELDHNLQKANRVRWDIPFAEPIPAELLSDKSFMFNGWEVEIIAADSLRNTITVLGPDTPHFLREGLNSLWEKGQDLANKSYFWLKEKRLGLQRFEVPYKKSFAIIAAIDDYDRVRDKDRRGSTGLVPLKGTMVRDGKRLKQTLMTVGFPETNILTFFDEEATSKAIHDALMRFWKGNDLADADRVFFYFGGHGIKSDRSALLVTYDYNPKHPTSTAISIRDLIGEQAENVVARHVLFALDSCFSGLAHLGDSSMTSPEELHLQQLIRIRADTEPIARNMLVAGTGDQSATWENGGLFTNALIDGLNGRADLNNDGLIQFDELARYVRDRVTIEAGTAGFEQTPDSYVLSQFGTGRVLFIKNH